MCAYHIGVRAAPSSGGSWKTLEHKLLKGSQKFLSLDQMSHFGSWKLLIWPKNMEVDKVADEVADMVKRNDSSLCFACGDVLILTTDLLYILHPINMRKKEMTTG